jgi:hypothetical protein
MASHPRYQGLFPNSDKVERALRVLIWVRGGPHHILRSGDAYEPLADFFDLSLEARTVSRDDYYGDNKSEPAWRNIVQWARRKLNDYGQLRPSAHGMWQLSQRGLQEAERDAALMSEPEMRILRHGAAGLRRTTVWSPPEGLIDRLR